ncbi:unnamed protein product [Urochloa humidicola]
MGPGGSEEANGPGQVNVDDEMSVGNAGGAPGSQQAGEDGGIEQHSPSLDVQRVVPSPLSDAPLVMVPPGFAPLDVQVISNLKVALSIPNVVSLSLASCFTSLDIDLNFKVPPHIVDEQTLICLASVLVDQPASPKVLIGPALPSGGLPLVDYPDSDDDDVLEIQGPLSSTPRKRRARKLKEQLPKDFVRRSKRLNPDHGGFRDAASAEAAAANPSIYAPVVDASSSLPAHLTINIMQGPAEGFLKMQPGVVYAATLLELDDEE